MVDSEHAGPLVDRSTWRGPSKVAALVALAVGSDTGRSSLDPMALQPAHADNRRNANGGIARNSGNFKLGKHDR